MEVMYEFREEGHGEEEEEHLGSRPIMYVEDRTYTYIPSAQGRSLVRRWRHMLERLHGLYNVIDSHKCGERCFGSLGMQLEAPEVGETLHKKPKTSLMTPTTTTTTTTTMNDPMIAPKIEPELVVEVISNVHSIYGCPRSAIVHVCSNDLETRRRFCEHQITDLDGAVRCRFSGKELSGNEYIYNAFTDNTIEVRSTKPKNGKADREHRAVTGEGNETAATAAARHTFAHLQKTNEQQYQQSQMRNIQALLKRRQPNENPESNAFEQSVVPSMTVSDQLGFPTKVLTQSDVSIMRSHQAAAVSSPTSLSTSVPPFQRSKKQQQQQNQTNGINPKQMLLPGGLIISKDTHSKILRYVTELLANATANAHIKHPLPALSNVREHKDNQFLRFYAQRVAIVYSLVSNQGKRDRTNAKSARKQGQAACLNVNIRELVVTMLYVFGSGFNTNRGNLIAADAQLRALLPPHSNLVYYGLPSDVLREIQQNDQQLDKRTIAAMSVYNEAMHNIAVNKLQRVILGADEPGGIGREKLARVLNTSLMDFAKENNIDADSNTKS